ncbi:glutathione S-transferase family protein [Roseibium denhamense]|uniref:Glutathione S-transferase n=1 Tax=Roseibium denhamense TaxID=76305 RepID=A0ABY1P344_9HYPH|nr:glutathione S-transferase family protein [Roseibium denhamense]MTI07715.1 glutathione S-transferase family protein [Roseibium denhamense]SMP24831.1 glutathione S-transferase [Roseibium denhamense]
MTSQIKIWGRINSSNVRKVLWCAEELGLDYEQIDAGGAFGVVQSPDYLALNPNGRIPCLQDGDFVLWESNAICRYLARKYGAAPFAPDDLESWSRADQWMDWVINFGLPFRNLFWEMVRTKPEDRDPAVIETGIAHCTGLLEVADAVLAKQPYLSGDELGVGDIPFGSLAYAWFNMEIERPDLPHLAAWYQRLADRSAYQKGVMSPLT